MRRLALVPILATACLYSLSAHALGLGRIEMQSALNQRLDAEIPLRGVPSGEVDDIKVGLASEEAFRNVGLDRPFSLTRLRFEVQQRGNGTYFVHVSSRKPIVEPFLSFLVQVDWSGGNLLREYTVLLDPPVFTSEQSSGSGTTANTASTASGGNEAGVPGEIEREPTGNEATTASQSDSQAMSSAGQSTAETGGGDKPVFLQTEEREEQAERATAEADRQMAQDEQRDQAGTSATQASSDQGERQYGPVARGETLWGIASRLKSGDMTVQQMMLALLRYNPEAFRGGNINRLEKGYVLRVPDADTVRSVSAQRAIAQVQDQNGVWREWQGKSRSASTVAASEQSAGASGNGGQAAAGSDSNDAELSIVGADEGGASSDESASATGSSGASESNKLQLTREQLESAKMEKAELQSRVDELEQTVNKMEKLLSIRSQKLSELQDELGQIKGEGASTDRNSADDQTGNDDATAEDTMAEDAMAATDTGGGDGGSAGNGTQVADNSGGDTGSGEQTDSMASTDESGTATADASGSEDATASDVTSSGVTSSGATDDASAEAATDDSASGASSEASTTASADQDYVPAGKQATDADREVATSRTHPSERGWLDQVSGVLAGFGGALAGVGLGALTGPMGLALLAALLLLGGGLIMMRRRRADAEDDEFDFESAALDTGAYERTANESPADDDDGDVAVAAREPSHSSSDSEEAESALLAEEFDIGSFDDDDDTALADGATGLDDEDSEKDDTVAEADVYLAYGLHQQAEDLLRLALRDQPDNAVYQEKLLETLYAAGKSDEFVEEAGTLKGMLGDSQGDLWQRTLAMGRDLAPQEPMFAEGETAFSASDVQPSRPAGADLEFDEDSDDDFADTLLLDTNEPPDENRDENRGVTGADGLVGPDEPAPAAGGAADPADDDLEFDLSGLDPVGGAPGEQDSHQPGSSTAAVDDSDETDALDFDFEDESISEASPDDSTSSATADDSDLDFDFDIDTDTERSAANAPPVEADSASDSLQDDAPLEDDPLEIGDLDLDDESIDEADRETPASEAADSEPAESSLRAGEETADAFDPSELDTDASRPEASSAPTAETNDATSPADDDEVFDLSEFEQTDAEREDDGFNLDDFASENATTAPADNIGDADQSESPAEANAGDGEEDEEFDTMLDLARAYIDMGDPESAGNALEEVSASGNERQRAEAQSLLESVR